MNPPVLSSTLLLTILLMVGLFFFIRASVKERIEQITLIASDPPDRLRTQLQQYFEERSYQLDQIDEQTEQITYQGLVRPSWFLAIFLSVLAGFGFLCIGLVLSYLVAAETSWFNLLVLFAPMAGYFYWKKAKRVEKVIFKVESAASEAKTAQNWVKVRGHRDELAQLQRFFRWPVQDWD